MWFARFRKLEIHRATLNQGLTLLSLRAGGGGCFYQSRFQKRRTLNISRVRLLSWRNNCKGKSDRALADKGRKGLLSQFNSGGRLVTACPISVNLPTNSPAET